MSVSGLPGTKTVSRQGMEREALSKNRRFTLSNIEAETSWIKFRVAGPKVKTSGLMVKGNEVVAKVPSVSVAVITSVVVARGWVGVPVIVKLPFAAFAELSTRPYNVKSIEVV